MAVKKVFIKATDWITLIILSVLFFHSLFVSRAFNFEEFHESGLAWGHNPFISILGMLVFIMGLYIIYGLLSRVRTKNQREFFICALIIFGIFTAIIGLLWIKANPFVPRADQEKVWGAAVKLASGVRYNEDELLYFDMYPQQNGMIVWMSLITCIFGDNLMAFRFWNLFHTVIFVLTVMICSREFSDDTPLSVIIGLLLVSFLPLAFYNTFVYGLTGSIAYLSLSFLGLTEYRKTQKSKWLILPVIFMPIAYLIYKASAIFIIAFVIIFFLYTVCSGQGNRKWISLIATVAGVLLLIFIIEKGCDRLTAARLGKIGLGKGTPALTEIAMGLEYDENMHFAGGHTGKDERLYEDNGRDTQKAAEESLELIKEYMIGYITGERSRYFFVKKTEYQWLDPWFSGLTMTVNDITSDKKEWNNFFQSGFLNILEYYLYILLTAVYFGGACCQFIRIFKSGDDNIINRFPNVFFIGGFVFQLFWEQKARYCLPYYLSLFPLAGFGIISAAGIIKHGAEMCFLRVKHKAIK